MEPEVAQVSTMLASSVLTGIVSTMGTVKALGIHITYLRESIAKLEQAVERAHTRIDELEKRE